MTYKANSKEDVAALAQRICDTPDRCQLAADVCGLGLMNFREPMLQNMIVLLRNTNTEAVDKFFNLVNLIHKDTLIEFIEDTANHVEYGIDTEDEDSVGGWSQREIDLLVSKRGWND